MSAQKQATIRWTAGLATAMMLVYMSYLSMTEGYILQWPVLVGMIAVIILLMYGTTEMNRFLNAYDEVTNRHPHSRDNEEEP